MRGISLVVFVVVAALGLFIYPWAASAKELHRLRRSLPKVAGGSLASITDFPYAVQLKLVRGDGRFQCGGSIIHPNIVLTAAHCVKRLPDTFSSNSSGTGALGVTVIAGESLYGGNGPHSQRRKVTKIRQHPDFNNVTLENDLAVLLLAEPFDLDKVYVSQVALPVDSWQIFSGKAQVCGWGRLKAGSDDSNDDLRKADLRLVSNSVCDSYYIQFQGSVQLCAGGDGPEKACPGDSGGPLVCHAHTQFNSHSRSQPYLCGVTSGGDNCKPGNGPGVYVRVSVFVHWIETQIQELTGQGQRQDAHPSPAPPPPPSYSYEQPSYVPPPPYYGYNHHYPFDSSSHYYYYSPPSSYYYGGYGGYGYGYGTPSYSYPLPAPHGPQAPAYYFGYSPPNYGYSYN